MKKFLKKIKLPWYNTWTWYEKWIHFYIDNPLKTWWKARKYFKRPKIHCYIGTPRFTCPYATYSRIGKILDIYSADIMWKDKWNSPRHERSPYVWICLFNKICFTITFHIYYRDEFGEKKAGDMEYWEYLLEWLYYRNKKTLRCYSAWTGDSRLYRTRIKYGNKEDGTEDEWGPTRYVVPTVAMSLTKEGIKKLKEELNDKK